MQPVRRDFSFQLPADRIGDWHPEGPYVSHFLNTLSLFFPVGERFFIHSVRHYRDRITDPELQQAVTAFIGQEAMHGREHEAYNAAAAAAGYPVDRFENEVRGLLEFIKARLPKSSQLSATIALEHMTAIMADKLLAEHAILDNAEPHYAAIWNWHALEETEHKAVAYDVWTTVFGETPARYVERVSGLVLANVIFWPLVVRYYASIVRQDATLKRGWRDRARGLARAGRFLFVSPGGLSRCMPDLIDYFRPGFHPWDHDNRAFLSRIDALEADMRDMGLLEAA